MNQFVRQAWQRLIALGFTLLYHDLAWTYDAVSWIVSLGEWRAWQLSALQFVHGPNVLELGHGPGHMLVQLADAGHRVVGLDKSPQMGGMAARRLQQHGLPAPVVEGSAQALPFAGAYFNTVLATFPTEYIVDAATLQNIAHVLAPNGRLIIVPQAQLTGSGRVVRLLEWLYTITGQRGSDDSAKIQAALPANWQFFQARLAENGFDCQFNEVQLESSRVTIIVGTKTRTTSIRFDPA
jgi:ubiquinone/menaquinone biosynthesis C-methylase UbiE